MPSHNKHDSYDENGYKKRCYCEKCKKSYDDWCEKNEEDGVTHCKRKCYTICEIVCEKPVTTVTHWGYKKEYEGKWESYRAEEAPKKCHKCKHEMTKCSCEKYSTMSETSEMSEMKSYKKHKKHYH